MLKKFVSITLATVMAIGGLAGCSGSDKGGTAEGDISIKIGAWPSQDSAEYEKYESMRKEFMEKNPNIKVETDTWGFELNTFLPKAASGQLPDIYVTSFTEIKRIIDSGYAADVTKYLDKYEYTKYLRDDIKELISKDDSYYAVPQDAYVMGLYINLNMFKKAGLMNEDGTPKVPATWEELAETAKTIKEKTGEAGFAIPTMNNCGGWHFVNFAWSYGTSREFMEQTDGKWKANFATPETAQALSFIQDLKYKYNAVPENALLEHGEMVKMFASDRLGMFLATPPQDSLTQTHKMDRNSIAIASMPAGPKGKFTQMGGNLRVLKKGLTEEQTDACFKWLDFIGVSPNITDDSKKSKEDLMKINDESGKLVGVKNFSMWKQEGEVPEVEKFDNELTDKYANVDTRMFADFQNFDGLTIVPEPPINCQQLYNILDGCIQSVLLDESADASALLEKAQSDFQINYLDKAE